MSTKTKTIKLSDGERIIAVVPSYEQGPAWSSAIIKVYIADRDNNLRTERIQRTERNPVLHSLFDIGLTVHKRLVDAVLADIVEQN